MARSGYQEPAAKWRRAEHRFGRLRLRVVTSLDSTEGMLDCWEAPASGVRAKRFPKPLWRHACRPCGPAPLDSELQDTLHFRSGHAGRVSLGRTDDLTLRRGPMRRRV